MSLLEQVSLHAFIQNNQIRTEAGEILDFKKYRFMYDIYADRSPLICCIKCAQIGFTTYQILKSAHECKNDGIDIVYVLPTDADVTTFSGGKTNKIIGQNPIFQTWTKDKDSIEQKQFGKNTIYYRGSWTSRAALSFTAKKLVVDEYDRCKPEIVEQYDSRLQSVANPKKAFFSNPSIPDFGVDKWYKKSDQKKWHITHSCSEKYVMDEGCVDFEAEIYRCPHCKGEITDDERRMGEWIATSTGEWSGYWIPLWIAPWMPAKKIAQAKKEKSAEFFANFVAGLPYAGGGAKLSQADFFKNVIPGVNQQDGRIIIGVDTGLPIHYTLMNKDGVFYQGKCSEPTATHDPYDELARYLDRYPRSIMVADQGGDLIGIRKLQAQYPGRVYLCYYRKDKKGQEMIRWGSGTEEGTVVVDRNRMIQMIVDQLREGVRIVFNGNKEDWQELGNHFGNIYRVVEETPYGMEFRWERSGADHFVHSLVYAMVGFDKFKDDDAIIIGSSNDNFLGGMPTGRMFK